MQASETGHHSGVSTLVIRGSTGGGWGEKEATKGFQNQVWRRLGVNEDRSVEVPDRYIKAANIRGRRGSRSISENQQDQGRVRGHAGSTSFPPTLCWNRSREAGSQSEGCRVGRGGG